MAERGRAAGMELAAPQIIPARKNRLAIALMERLYIGPALKRHFHTVWLSVEPAAAEMLLRTARSGRAPVIYAATHPSWWDGHIAWLVERSLGRRDAYLMMDLVSLRNFGFFTLGGAFSVDRENPRSALASIEYIAAILRAGPDKALWIFPHGTITPPDRRPLRIYPGVAHVVRRLDNSFVVPVVWRVEYRLEQHPEVFARVGAPQAYGGERLPASREITRRLEEALAAEDDGLRDLLARTAPLDPLPGYRPLMRGRGSTHRNWERVLEAARRARERLLGKSRS